MGLSPTLACWYWVSDGSNTSSLTGCISIDRLFYCQIDEISWKNFLCSVDTNHPDIPEKFRVSSNVSKLLWYFTVHRALFGWSKAKNILVNFERQEILSCKSLSRKLHDIHGLVEHTSSRILLFFLFLRLLLQRHIKGSLW